jgi:hypothetical protein
MKPSEEKVVIPNPSNTPTTSPPMKPSEKKFAIPKEQIRKLIPSMGGCLASDRIMVDGESVGYMYREKPDNEHDSGWRFLAGDESQDYNDDPDHVAVYDVNTVANYDPDIIPYLETKAPCAFRKDAGRHSYRKEE